MARSFARVPSELPVVELPRSLARALHAGHPWIYKEHLPPRFSARNGSWVRVRSGSFTAFALYDATSPLALRIYSRMGEPDAAWVEQRVAAAAELRAVTGVSEHATAFRWVSGEGDGLPGVTVDRYAGFAVVAIDGAAFEPLVPWIVAALRRSAPLAGIVRRHRHRGPGYKIEVLWGRLPPSDLIVEEHGVRFRANLREGQKTGLFLDQRDNRRFVGGLSAGRRVLNLFGYTGGFSVHASLGGAASVTTVDSAEAAVLDAQENFRLNGQDPDAHAFVVADAFEYLKQTEKARDRFDVVISDPPSFARSRTQRGAALDAYVRLHAAALGVVSEGGLYCASSCTTQVGVDAFRGTLAQAGAKIGRRLQLVHDAGQPADHPILAGHPEGRYLKFMVVKAGPHA